MKILVVEDDKTVGQYVRRGLEEQGYQADWVDDGLEALRLVGDVEAWPVGRFLGALEGDGLWP